MYIEQQQKRRNIQLIHKSQTHTIAHRHADPFICCKTPIWSNHAVPTPWQSQSKKTILLSCLSVRGCLKALWPKTDDLMKTWCQGAWRGTPLGIWLCHDTHLLHLKTIVNNRLDARLTMNNSISQPDYECLLLKQTCRRGCDCTQQQRIKHAV